MWRHRGSEIEVTGHGKFAAKVGDMTVVADSLQEVKNKIDIELAPATKTKLELDVIGILAPHKQPRKLVRTIITGINRTTRDIITDYKSDSLAQRFFPWSVSHEELLSAFLEAQARYDELHQKIQKIELKVDGWGRMEAADYKAALDALTDDYNKKSQL